MEKTQESEAKTVNKINLIALGAMLLLCLTPTGGVLSFFMGLLFGLGNFISMIVFIVNKRPEIYVSNIIWMLLMPIIGFGCCAASFSGFH